MKFKKWSDLIGHNVSDPEVDEFIEKNLPSAQFNVRFDENGTVLAVAPDVPEGQKPTLEDFKTA